MTKEQNVNSKHCFEHYCQYFLVTKMNKLNEHKTKFYKVQHITAINKILPGTLFMHYLIFLHVLLQLQTKLLFTELQGDLPEGVDKQCFCTEVNGNENSS